MAPQEIEPGAGSPSVRLGDNFSIFPTMEAAEFRAPSAASFRAGGRDYPGASLFALVCDPSQPPRIDLIEPLGALYVDGLMRPLAWGVVDWPLHERRCFAVVFEDPGSRVANTLDDAIPPLSEDDLLRGVLPSLLPPLKALHGLGHAHRAIRPTNLFRRTQERRIVLGECVSGPPGAAQPAAFESIERALADPAGRGAGGPGDDLYALGVTLIFLHQGRNLVAEIDDDALLADKINRGSLAALTGSARPPARLLEVLRGLLADEPKERWTLADLETWLLGRRLSPKQIPLPHRAGRPLDLNDTSHVTARSLARAMVHDRAAAAKLVKSGAFEVWVQRSLADNERTAAVTQALAEAPESGGQEARIVARVAMALDPPAPVRYAGMSVAVDGFGTALAAACRAGSGATTIVDAIMARLPQFWFGLQGALKQEQAPQLRSFDRMRQHLEDPRPGFGIERVLYDLNPTLHCQSAPIEQDNVLVPDDLLAALERAAAAGRLGDTVIDRHLAAYIAARWRSAGLDWFDGLASREPQERALATLQVLARLQRLRGPTATPALTERLARQAPALIERFHSRPRRARLMTALGRIAGGGNLVALHALVADPDEQQRDDAEFSDARQEFLGLERALAALHEGADARHRAALVLGGRLGVGVAFMLGWSAALAGLLLAA